MLTLAKDIRDSDGDLSSNTCWIEVLGLTVGGRRELGEDSELGVVVTLLFERFEVKGLC